MHDRKSARHARAAETRWRAHSDAAERDAGVPAREPITDCREPVVLDLNSYGGKRLRIEPRLGYVSCRVIDDETGAVLQCAAIKTALHRIADSLPRPLGARNLT